ncbi:hypothetical protein EVAR_16630_1 [Eumeta japonica]|uniref:Uncharacterized protein n=1 Tax=Eumeta variegata TaxID=151549 RepID=A0A4C1V0R1_EUMVA|nr:hypothetical protein EVAR_16630_1 [Eumeta japonica]
MNERVPSRTPAYPNKRQWVTLARRSLCISGRNRKSIPPQLYFAGLGRPVSGDEPFLRCPKFLGCLLVHKKRG